MVPFEGCRGLSGVWGAGGRVGGREGGREERRNEPTREATRAEGRIQGRLLPTLAIDCSTLELFTYIRKAPRPLLRSPGGEKILRGRRHERQVSVRGQAQEIL